MRPRATIAALAACLAASACGGGGAGGDRLGAQAPAVTITSITAPATTTVPTTSPTTSVATTTTRVPATSSSIDTTANPYGTVEISGTPLPPAPQAGEDPGIGLSMPSIRGTDFSGNPVIVTADGRAKMLVFLAHWCPHCQRELPIVQDWLDAAPLPPGVDVYAVATLTRPDRDNFPPGPWFARNGWSSPVIVDDPFDTAAGAFGLVSVPYWVIVDATGTVVARGSGGVPPEVLTDIAQALSTDASA